jgi:nicotinamide-nucleotide amidase
MRLNSTQQAELKDFVNELLHKQIHVVIAESCTAGLVSALLGQVPGVSNVFCGSMVVYRASAKQDWLDLDPKMLADPSRGTVCAETTRQLAVSVLQATPEANWSVAITGHLGPGAPVEQDGSVFLATATRNEADAMITDETLQHLLSTTPLDSNDIERRAMRQQEAAWMAIDFLRQSIKRFSPR